MEPITYTPSKTTEFFYKINIITYIFGFPNFWIEDLKLPKLFLKFYGGFAKVNNSLQFIMILLELGAFITQHHLTEKQRFNLWLFAISHPILLSYRLIMLYHEKNVRRVIFRLTVALKTVYNDAEVEKQMIASSKLYLFALAFSCMVSMVTLTYDAFCDMIENDVTFTTLVTMYPLVEDRSTLGSVARVIINLTWWTFVTRIIALYVVVIPITTCLGHQYKNLQSYFYSLNEIFKRDDLSQRDKENQYERQFKEGIKMHGDTLRCAQKTQTICSEVFSGQIIFNIVLLVILMAQTVKSEKNMSNLLSAGFTAVSILIGTGFFMWNSGDITIEASRLSTAIYSSGWHNVQGHSSTRIGKLVTITLNRAQRPVVLKGLGYIELSYEAYLQIVKSSYSVFSVLF